METKLSNLAVLTLPEVIERSVLQNASSNEMKCLIHCIVFYNPSLFICHTSIISVNILTCYILTVPSVSSDLYADQHCSQ
jgi:hypothetical protein